MLCWIKFFFHNSALWSAFLATNLPNSNIVYGHFVNPFDRETIFSDLFFFLLWCLKISSTLSKNSLSNMFTLQRSTFLCLSAMCRHVSGHGRIRAPPRTSIIFWHHMNMTALQVLPRSFFFFFNVMLQCCDCSNNCLSDCEVKVLFGLLLTAAAAHSQTFHLGRCHEPSVQENFNVTKVKEILFLDVFPFCRWPRNVAGLLRI